MKGEVKSLEEAGCPDKMNCKKSHGWLESKYHPSNPQNVSSQQVERQGCANSYPSKNTPNERGSGTRESFLNKSNRAQHPESISIEKCIPSGER